MIYYCTRAKSGRILANKSRKVQHIWLMDWNYWPQYLDILGWFYAQHDQSCQVVPEDFEPHPLVGKGHPQTWRRSRKFRWLFIFGRNPSQVDIPQLLVLYVSFSVSLVNVPVCLILPITCWWIHLSPSTLGLEHPEPSHCVGFPMAFHPYPSAATLSRILSCTAASAAAVEFRNMFWILVTVPASVPWLMEKRDVANPRFWVNIGCV